MMKKGHLLFCAATLVVAAAHLTSCTQDDENYANDMYTMAEKLETRAGEPAVNTMQVLDTCICTFQMTLMYKEGVIESSFNADVIVRLFRKDNAPYAELVDYLTPSFLYRVQDAWLEEDASSNVYWLHASGQGGNNLEYNGKYEDYAFY